MAENILFSIPNDRSLRENAILAEKKGYREQAANLYSKVSSSVYNIHTQAISAIKAFILSRGRLDCFDKINLLKFDKVGREYFKAITATKRSDIGGLDRVKYFKLINNLPSLEKLIDSIQSLDGAKYFFQILSELARIQHEAKEWEKALELDQRAYRIVQGIADSGLMSMCVGNIGVCYMGLAEDETGEKQKEYLKTACQWLQESVQLSYIIDLFSWALHSCNLGVANCNLECYQQGISLLESSLPVLKKIYPNYAICFLGDLSRYYALMAAEIIGKKQVFLIDKSIKSLETGINLSNQLNDWDDLGSLKAAAKELKNRNFLTENFFWLL